MNRRYRMGWWGGGVSIAPWSQPAQGARRGAVVDPRWTRGGELASFGGQPAGANVRTLSTG
jgi:hypothetical protein